MSERPKVQKIAGADGVVRPIDEERALNELFAAVFASNGAREALDYLRSVTINAIAGPDASDGQIRHMEGQRFAVALIERRIQLGRSKQPRLPGERSE